MQEWTQNNHKEMEKDNRPDRELPHVNKRCKMTTKGHKTTTRDKIYGVATLILKLQYRLQKDTKSLVPMPEPYFALNSVFASKQLV